MVLAQMASKVAPKTHLMKRIKGKKTIETNLKIKNSAITAWLVFGTCHCGITSVTCLSIKRVFSLTLNLFHLEIENGEVI